ncbi:MAG: c-type cytochrome domain-containing protein, partial [Bacteroidota bacterium]
GEEEVEEVDKVISKTADSIGIYADLIAPVFEEKCNRCHDDEIQRGGLNMSHPEGLHAGGDHGEVIAGSAAESELFRRVTLLPDHSKYMPLKGTPMTFKEIKLMEWWLESGASFEANLKDQEVPKDIKFVLLEEYGVDLSEKSYYEKVKVAIAAEKAIQAIEEVGFKVETLAAGNGLLEVSYNGKEVPNLAVLTQAKEQITWLDLGNVDLSGVDFAPLSQLKNLTRLQLENTVTTDENIAILVGLKHLESLNLHHSKVTDKCLESIEKMAGLKRVYLWETEVTKEAVEDLRSKREDLEIDMGFSFEPIAKNES